MFHIFKNKNRVCKRPVVWGSIFKDLEKSKSRWSIENKEETLQNEITQSLGDQLAVMLRTDPLPKCNRKSLNGFARVVVQNDMISFVF